MSQEQELRLMLQEDLERQSEDLQKVISELAKMDENVICKATFVSTGVGTTVTQPYYDQQSRHSQGNYQPR